MKLDPYLAPYTKINSKLIKGLNVILKTIKILEENIEQKLYDIGFVSDILDMTLKAQVKKEKNRQTELNEHLKNFVHHRHYSQSKKAKYRMGEIFANHIPDKGLMSRIYKELLKLNNNNEK